MNSPKLLYWALRGNASFSVLTAVPMLAWPEMLGQWMGFESPLVYRIIGALLILFAIDLFSQTMLRKPSGLRALATCVADLGWILATGIIIAFWSHHFSNTGLMTMVAVAGMVLLFATLQWQGLGHLYASEIKSGWAQYCVQFDVPASRDAVWKVIGDIANIDKYGKNLASVTIIEGEPDTVGCVRECRDHAGKVWSEEVVEYVPHSHFTVRFRHEEKDFPFPVAAMEGTWRLSDVGDAGTRLTMRWEILPKRWLPANALIPLLDLQNSRMLPQLAARMALAARGKPYDTIPSLDKMPWLRMEVC
jgi:hypothetical protein